MNTRTPLPTPQADQGRSLKGAARRAVFLSFFLMGSVFGCWASRIPDVKRALELSDGALGMALFAAPVGEFLGVFAAPLLIARFGSRNVSLASLIAYATVLMGLGVAPSLACLAVTLFLFGFMADVLNIAINTQAVDVEILYRRPIMSAFHGMWSLGGVAGGLAGAVAAPLGVSPLAHFTGMAAAALMGGLIAWPRLLPRALRRSSERPRHRGRWPRPGTFIILLGVIAFANMAVEGTMYDWSAVFFLQVIQPGEALVRCGFVACMTAMVAGRFVDDRLVAAFGATRVIQMGGVCVACGIALACAMPTVPSATLGFALVGFGMAPAIPLCYSLAGRSRRVSPSVAIAIISTISFFGVLMSPAAIGFLSHAVGLRLAFVPLAVMGLLAMALSPLLPAAEAAQTDTPAQK